MSQFLLIPKQAFIKVPWKNGLGFTREIAKLKHTDNERFIWRLSIAEVKQDGPFSCFEGYQRNISVLTGEGMTLTVDGVSSGLLKPFEAFPFSGEAKTTCTLTDGKIDDFNVIYDPAFVKATVQWVDPVQAMEIVLPPNSTVFVIAGKGEATVRIDASSFNLDCWDVVQINLDHEPIEFALPGQPATKVGIVVIQAL